MGPSQGKTHPHEVSLFVFQNGSSFTLHHPDLGTTKSQPLLRCRPWSHTCSDALSHERRKTICQAGKPRSLPFFFFSIFSQKGDVGLSTISSYSFPQKETPSTLVHSAHGLTCDHKGSDSTSVHPSQGRHGAHPWGWFAQPSAVVLGNVC